MIETIHVSIYDLEVIAEIDSNGRTESQRTSLVSLGSVMKMTAQDDPLADDTPVTSQHTSDDEDDRIRELDQPVEKTIYGYLAYLIGFDEDASPMTKRPDRETVSGAIPKLASVPEDVDLVVDSDLARLSIGASATVADIPVSRVLSNPDLSKLSSSAIPNVSASNVPDSEAQSTTDGIAAEPLVTLDEIPVKTGTFSIVRYVNPRRLFSRQSHSSSASLIALPDAPRAPPSSSMASGFISYVLGREDAPASVPGANSATEPPCAHLPIIVYRRPLSISDWGSMVAVPLPDAPRMSQSIVRVTRARPRPTWHSTPQLPVIALPDIVDNCAQIGDGSIRSDSSISTAASSGRVGALVWRRDKGAAALGESNCQCCGRLSPQAFRRSRSMSSL